MKVIAHHHDIGQTLMTVADGLDLSAIRRLAADRLDISPSGEPEAAAQAIMTDFFRTMAKYFYIKDNAQ